MLVTGLAFLFFCSCLVTAVQFEGGNCTLEATNEEGQCTLVHECENATKLSEDNESWEVCGFLRNLTLVCCPVIQNLIVPQPGKLAQEKCEEYYKIRPIEVYLPPSRPTLPPAGIYLGQKARSKEFPHMAAVGYGNSEKSIVWLCGGTLISYYFVLSAAHCVYSIDFGPAKWIRLGDLAIGNTTENENPQDVRISQTYVHPQYKASSHYHDIALFKMEKRTYFDSYFTAACLQIEKNLPGNDVQATGFGKFDLFEEDTSGNLMKLNLSVVDHETCSRKYSTAANSRRLKNGIVDETLICAGNAEGGDTCPGASGGPLHYRVEETDYMKQHFVVAGVTSFGKGCGQEDSAGVYTRVSAYIGWIENTVWGNNFDELPFL